MLGEVCEALSVFLLLSILSEYVFFCVLHHKMCSFYLKFIRMHLMVRLCQDLLGEIPGSP